MARHLGLTAAALAVLALGACGKSQQTNAPESPSAPTEPASAPPTPASLSDAQKKTLLSELPAAYQGADLSNGETKFAVCATCHSLPEGGADQIGPNLWGVFGRKAGSKASFTYSDDMKNAGWTWDADHLDKWITNPRALLPGTKMTYLGMADPNDRRDVIAFLKVSTSPAPKS